MMRDELYAILFAMGLLALGNVFLHMASEEREERILMMVEQILQQP